MSIERHRKRLLADPRHWGDQVPCLPHTPSPTRSPVHECHQAPLAEPDPSPDPLPDPPAGPLEESTHLIIPIPANTTMISTKGWSLNFLINQSINFHRVPRVSVLSDTLLQSIDDHETSGVPLVIEGCHKHPKWSTEEFTLDSFASASSNEISVRNVHNWQDTTIPLSDFISKSRSIAAFAEEGEQERFYGKDAHCPERWEDWLKKANVVPESLLSGGPQDFFRYRPQTSQVETLMCYLGVGDTFTPCHKDLCASSGQNLMCHTENDGSSFWFMTESDSALEVAEFFHSLGRELDHENYVITVEELTKAPFKVYILEQKLGDLVLVPPRSAHQVVNFGGITVKTSWSRMTLKGLVTAYHHELPIYRRVCRPETYQVKSTIRYVLSGLTSDLRSLAHKNGSREEHLVSNIQKLLAVFDHILAEEESDTHSSVASLGEANVTENISCDFCGADIFQGFFECRTCVEVDSAEGGYIVCPGCYVEGRSCKHQIMQPMQCRPFECLLDTRKEAIQVVDMYEGRYGRTFQLSNDINNSYLRTFRAALVLLDIYKTKAKSTTKVCSLRQVGGSHIVPSSSALYCKLCHHAKCFSHVLSDRRIHSVEALLLHDNDNTHHEYHHNHTVERRARFEISLLEHSPLVYYAINFTYCKPINPRFMELGWYDKNAHMSYILDDQQSPAEMESKLVPEATVPVCAEIGPVVVHLPTNEMPELTVKRTMKRKAYVLVPPAPYPLPHHSNRSNQANSSVFVPLATRDELQPTVNRPEHPAPYPLPHHSNRSNQANSSTFVPLATRDELQPTVNRPEHPAPYPLPYHSNRSNHANSSTSVPLVTRDELQPTVNRPEQKVPPLQVDDKVPKTLSDIGISIPTTVRQPGSFIIHTLPHIITQSAEHLMEPVNPRTKPPHVGNPVTAQVITKGSISTLKFKKSKVKPTPPPSNNTTVVASTDTQGGPKSPELPQSQPKPPMPLPEVSNDVTELVVRSIADKVMVLLTEKSHPQQHSGPPPQYNGPPHHYPQQHISPPLHFGHYRPRHYSPPLPFVHYSPPPQHNDRRPQHNGPPPYFNHDPYVHPQRHNQVSHHAPSYPAVKQPQFHQDIFRSPPQKRGPPSAGKTAYVNRSQDHHNAHPNGRNTSGNSAWLKERPNKRRKYNNGRQDSQSQMQRPNPRFNPDARPPQGPRGRYNSSRTHSSPRRVVYERSTSRDPQQSPWRTGSEGTSTSTLLTEQSEYSQSQGAHENQGYYRQQNTSSKLETNFQSHYRSIPIEPEIQQSTQGRTNDGDNKDDVIDVDLYGTAPLETVLPMVDPTVPDTGIEQYDDDLYSNDSAMVMVTDEAPHEAGMPVDDNLPVPTVEDQGNDQDWESTYEIEDRASEVTLSAPQSVPQQLAPANSNSITESILNVADDSMADVTANPWTTS